MWYLFLQIWIWLVAAFALGWFAHWFFCCRDKENDDAPDNRSILDKSLSAMNQSAVVNSSETTSGLNLVEESWKPQGFKESPGQIDDLKRIKGVGAVIEKTLNELGIYQFAQIAQWNQDNAAWVDNFLSFSGRITRENWISQAATLNEVAPRNLRKK